MAASNLPPLSFIISLLRLLFSFVASVILLICICFSFFVCSYKDWTWCPRLKQDVEVWICWAPKMHLFTTSSNHFRVFFCYHWNLVWSQWLNFLKTLESLKGAWEIFFSCIHPFCSMTLKRTLNRLWPRYVCFKWIILGGSCLMLHFLYISHTVWVHFGMAPNFVVHL